MDPVIVLLLASIASLGGIGSLLKPFFKALMSSFHLKIGEENQNIEISITGSDGTVKSIKIDSSKSKQLSETEIKKIVDILKGGE